MPKLLHVVAVPFFKVHVLFVGVPPKVKQGNLIHRLTQQNLHVLQCHNWDHFVVSDRMLQVHLVNIAQIDLKVVDDFVLEWPSHDVIKVGWVRGHRTQLNNAVPVRGVAQATYYESVG